MQEAGKIRSVRAGLGTSELEGWEDQESQGDGTARTQMWNGKGFRGRVQEKDQRGRGLRMVTEFGLGI